MQMAFVFIMEISLYILIHTSDFGSWYIHQAFLSAFQTFREVVQLHSWIRILKSLGWERVRKKHI